MTDNNGKVTTKTFYEAQLETNKQIGNLETALTEYHGEVKVALSRLDTLEKTQGVQGKDIDDLQTSNVRWAGLNGVIAAIVAAITGWFATR